MSDQNKVVRSVRPMTEMQKRFADRYLETGNATQSYIDVGYKATTRKVADANARKLLAKSHIREFIDERVGEKSAIRVAKQDEVLEFLSDVMRGKVTEKIPLGLGMGEQALVKNELTGKDRIKAAELLGKRYGIWVDRQDVTGQVVVINGESELED